MTEHFDHVDLIVSEQEQDRWVATMAHVLPEGPPSDTYMGVCAMTIHHAPSHSCCMVESWTTTEQRLLAKLYAAKGMPFQVLGGANDGLEFRP